MKTGMVLEGGAMRGMYTAGVMDVLMESGIEFDGAVGVSAGAVFGCNYKSKQIGRVLRYNTRFCKDPRYGNIRSLLKTGDIYEAEFCYNEIPNRLDVFDAETFKNNPMEFYVTCTDADTGKPVYHRCENGDARDIRWMQASASMPFVSKAVEIDGQRLLDGGISDSVPVRWFMKQGYDKCLVILTRPEGYVKKPQRFLGILKHLAREYPAVFPAIRRRHIRYNKTIGELERLKKKGTVYIMRPSRLIKVSKMESDPDKLRALYELGRRDAKKQLGAIREFLCQPGAGDN